MRIRNHVGASLSLVVGLCFRQHRAFVTVQQLHKPVLGTSISPRIQTTPENSRRRPLSATYQQPSAQHDEDQVNSSTASKFPGASNPRIGRKHFRSRERHEPDITWLVEATNAILSSPRGSLLHGKVHEVHSMIQAWAKLRKHDPQVPLYIEKLIKRLLDEQRTGNAQARVTTKTYNTLLDAWACAAIFRTQDPQRAAQRAREILVSMQEIYEQETDINLQPNVDSFDPVFYIVCKHEGPVAASKLLGWMEYLKRVDRNPHAQPTRKQYVMLLDAYSNIGENAGIMTEAFIRHMKKVGVEVDTFCYNIAIRGWAKSKRGREAAEHADRILEEMEVPKDLFTYVTVMSAWKSSGMRSHAVARVEELFQNIQDEPHLEANSVVFNSVMATWVKSRDPEAVPRTRELLEMMAQSDHCGADLNSYNSHLHALSIHAHEPGNAERAHDLLQAMEASCRDGEMTFRPNLFSYNLVIEAWSKSEDPSAAWNAVKVLRQLIEKRQTDGPEAAEPDSFSFDQVLLALSRTSRTGAARLAEELLNFMIEAHRLKLYKYARPDVLSYTFAIVTIARSGESDAPERAERLLKDMKEAYEKGAEYLKPTRYIYNTLIDCWATSGKGTLGARKAEVLLQEMENLHSLGDSSLSPTRFTWNAVLNSWARSGTRCGGNKAEAYLERMWERYNAGAVHIAPNDKSFNTVINAISNGPYQDKAQKALRILRRMDKLYQAGYKAAKPDEVTYNSVLSSCAFPASPDQRTKKKAFDTAVFTWQELRDSRYAKPDEMTYRTFILACSNLLSEDDERLRPLLEDAFQQCCKDGKVGEIVLGQLRTSAPTDLYKDLLAEVSQSVETVHFEDLPPAWRRNVLTKSSAKR